VLDRAGARTTLVSIHDGEIAARNHDIEDAGTFTVDRVVGDVSVEDFDALLLRGGTVNPDQLRMNQTAVSFARDFVDSGKPVASICHGPWNLVEDRARGRRLTSWPSVRTDLRNAGPDVVDEEVVTDGNITTSRSRTPSRPSASAFCRSSPGRGRRPGQAEPARGEPAGELGQCRLRFLMGPDGDVCMVQFTNRPTSRGYSRSGILG
jgi:protease I